MKAAETRLLSQGKIKTLGLIFRHETASFMLPSYATIQEVTILHVPSSIYEKTEKDFLIVASIIVAETRLLLLGNFETKARNLAMKPKGFACVLCYYIRKSFVVYL